MKRSLILALLLLLTVPAFAEDVTVHLDVSDSVRDAMARGQIKALRVAIATQGYADTTTTTATISNVAPGTWTARAIILTAMTQYVVDPAGMKVDIAAGVPSVLTLPVHSIFVTGSVALQGKQLHQFSVWPSERKPGTWGFAAPIDGEGRFAFPVPHAGDYNMEVWLEGRKRLTTIEHFPIKDGDREIHVALPEDSGR
jgi:hypothetical protein